MPKKILVSRQQKYEQTSVWGQTSCIINNLKEFHQSLLNSKGDKSLHLEKVGGWRRLCIYIYSQLDKCSGHLGVNLLTKGIKQNKYYGQRMEHGHQRWGSFWDFYRLHHLDSGHNHGNKRLFWKASKNTCFHIFSLGRTFDSSGFSSQVARWKVVNAGLMNFIRTKDLW